MWALRNLVCWLLLLCPASCDEVDSEVQKRRRTGPRKCGIDNTRKSPEAIQKPEIPPGAVAFMLGGISEQLHLPFIAIIGAKDNPEHVCGATLISFNFILSAGHCIVKEEETDTDAGVLYQPNEMYLRLRPNSQGQAAQNKTVEKIIPHPKFHTSRFWPNFTRPDLVLVKFSPELKQFDGDVSAACIPGNRYEPKPGEYCLIFGWGGKYGVGPADDYDPKYLLAPVIRGTTCNEKKYNWQGAIDETTEFCAGTVNRSPTQPGDSGGGVLCLRGGQWTIYGVTSVGHIKGKRPGIFASVAKQWKTLRDIMKNEGGKWLTPDFYYRTPLEYIIEGCPTTTTTTTTTQKPDFLLEESSCGTFERVDQYDFGESISRRRVTPGDKWEDCLEKCCQAGERQCKSVTYRKYGYGNTAARYPFGQCEMSKRRKCAHKRRPFRSNPDVSTIIYLGRPC